MQNDLQLNGPSPTILYVQGRGGAMTSYCSDFKEFRGPLSHIGRASTSYGALPAAASAAQVASALSAVQKKLEKVRGADGSLGLRTTIAYTAAVT